MFDKKTMKGVTWIAAAIAFCSIAFSSTEGWASDLFWGFIAALAVLAFGYIGSYLFWRDVDSHF